MFDPGNGGKKICLIDRADYLAMGAPVYPCDMSVGGGAVNGNHAGCKADPQNGDNGKDTRFELHKCLCYQIKSNSFQQGLKRDKFVPNLQTKDMNLHGKHWRLNHWKIGGD